MRRPSSFVPAVAVCAAIALPSTASPLRAQVKISSDAIELEFSGRLQFQLQTSSCTDPVPAGDSACEAEAPGLDMLVRRARLSLEATIDDRLSFKVEPDFASIDQLSLKDAWGRYAFGSGLAIQAGHFKRPFDGFQMESSSWLPFERSVIVPGVPLATLPSHSELALVANLSDRDVGAMLEGAAGERVDWWLGMFTGGSASRVRDTNTEKQVIARIQVGLGDLDAPIRLAGAFALTDAPFTALDGTADAEYYTDFELWAEYGGYGEDGPMLQAGLVSGDNPNRNDLGELIDLAAGDDFASLLSWQGVAGYRFGVADVDWLDAVGAFVRVSYADPSDADADEAWGFTPGVALYFHRRNRLAFSWDIASFAADGVGAENSLKAQMQFHF